MSLGMSLELPRPLDWKSNTFSNINVAPSRAQLFPNLIWLNALEMAIGQYTVHLSVVYNNLLSKVQQKSTWEWDTTKFCGVYDINICSVEDAILILLKVLLFYSTVKWPWQNPWPWQATPRLISFQINLLPFLKKNQFYIIKQLLWLLASLASLSFFSYVNCKHLAHVKSMHVLM